MSVLLLTGAARAVDIYDGVRAARGLYFLSYSSYYRADALTDASGRSAVDDFGYQSLAETLRLCWYSPDIVVTALVPFSCAKSVYLDDSAAGLGDVTIAAGGFLPLASVDLLALFAVKAPTGRFDESRAVNVGSGQWDFRPSLFVHKTIEPYTFDGAVKYFFRRENPATDLKPGDELHLEILATRRLGPLRLGPGVNWLLGENGEKNGSRVKDSAKQTLSLGAEAYLRLFDWSVTLNYMGDVYGENTPRGHLVKIKLCREL